jgi:hypothetical protein
MLVVAVLFGLKRIFKGVARGEPLGFFCAQKIGKKPYAITNRGQTGDKNNVKNKHEMQGLSLK